MTEPGTVDPSGPSRAAPAAPTVPARPLGGDPVAVSGEPQVTPRARWVGSLRSRASDLLDRTIGPPAGEPRTVVPAAVGGLIGTCLVAMGAMDGGALLLPDGGGWPIPLPHIPAIPGLGIVPALVAHYGGIVLLIRAWLSLRRARPAVPVVAAVAALWVLPLLLAPPIGSRDAYSYIVQGEVVHSGLPAYDNAADDLAPGPIRSSVDPVWFEVPTPYGPAWVKTASIAAALPGSQPVTGVLALRFVTLLGVALLAWGVPTLARRLGADAADAAVLVVANPLVLIHLVAGQHNEAVMAGLLVAGFAVAAGGRRRLGIALCALGGAVKLPAAAGGLVLGWGAPEGTPWRRRVLPALESAAITVGVLAACSIGTGLGFGWLRTATAPGLAVSWAAPTTWFGWLIGADLARTIGLGVAGVLALRWTLRAREADAAAAGSSLVGAAVLGPALHPWYLLWGLPLLAAARGGRPNRGFVAASIVAVLAGHPGGGQWFEAVLDVDPAVLAIAAGILLAFLLASRPLRPPAHSLQPVIDLR